MTISFEGGEIAASAPPFVIAEISANHNGSLERALAIVDAAADAGADAVKLQTYTADTMTIDVDDPAFRIDDPASLWVGRTLHDLYDEAHTPWEWHAPVFERARARGLVPFSTPFDDTAVDFLEALDAPLYKIASFEVVDIPLIRRVAATGRPLIISTGMASEDEIAAAVEAARGEGNEQIVLLKCTSSYPAPAADMNLAAIPVLAERHGCLVGLSDHTLDDVAAVAAVALGGVVVEKHFTLDRADGGVDSTFSLEPAELARLVTSVRTAWEARGEPRFGVTAAERGSTVFRRSLYVVEDVRAGEAFTTTNVRAIRPGYGLPPARLDEVLARRAARDVGRGTPLSDDLLG